MYKKPPVPVPAGRKYCWECEQALPLDAFHRRHSSPDGRTTPCIECAKVRRVWYKQKRAMIEDTFARIKASELSRCLSSLAVACP